MAQQILAQPLAELDHQGLLLLAVRKGAEERALDTAHMAAGVALVVGRVEGEGQRRDFRLGNAGNPSRDREREVLVGGRGGMSKKSKGEIANRSKQQNNEEEGKKRANTM